MNKRITYHILFWIGYVLFKTSLNLSSGTSTLTPAFHFEEFFTALEAQLALLIVKMPMVYALFYIAEKYFSKNWKTAKTAFAIFSLYIISLISFIAVVQFIVAERIYKLESSFEDHINIYSISYNSFVLIFPCSIALSIKLFRLNQRQKKAEQEIIKKKLETELQFLKAQTNPHFLFNTLNNIYALARKKSDATADVVMKLSKLLRFMLYESQKQYISISDEIHVLDDYIELEKIRYDEKLQLNFTRSIDNETHPIAPLILLPFVENAFKHGASESRFGSYINIDLKLQKSILYFRIENSKSEDLVKLKPENIGLNNIRRQLELVYPEHLLTIETAGNSFVVSLKINLDKYATV